VLSAMQSFCHVGAFVLHSFHVTFVLPRQIWQGLTSGGGLSGGLLSGGSFCPGGLRPFPSLAMPPFIPRNVFLTTPLNSCLSTSWMQIWRAAPRHNPCKLQRSNDRRCQTGIRHKTDRETERRRPHQHLRQRASPTDKAFDAGATSPHDG